MKKKRDEYGEYEESEDGTITRDKHMTVSFEEADGGAWMSIKWHSAAYKEAFKSLAEQEGTTEEDLMAKIFHEGLEKAAYRKGIKNTELLGVNVEYAPIQPATYSPPIIPRSPDPFTAPLYDTIKSGGYEERNTAMTPSDPATAFFLSALLYGGRHARKLPDGWEENRFGGSLHFERRHISGTGSTWRASIDALSGDTSELWEVIEGFSPLHVQVFLFLLAKMGDPRNKARYPLLEPFTIDADEILKAKNIKRRGKYNDSLLQDIAKCLEDEARLKIDVSNVLIHGRRERLQNVALFEIAERYSEQYTLEGGKDKYFRGWLVRPGMWARYFFSQENNTVYWVSAMARTLLELDHRDNRRADGLALKIAARYLVVPGGTNHKEGPITLRVSDFLAGIGELLDETDRLKNWANRLYEALGVALEALLSSGQLARYSLGDTYPDPDSLKKGWVERWLEADITLVALDAQHRTLLEQPRMARPKRAWRPKRPVPGADSRDYLDKDTAAALHNAMARQCINQRETARLLKISSSHLSNVLNRTRKPDAELLVRIKAFIDNALEQH